jgi:integral membrane protein
MPLRPKIENFPKIRGALKLYRVTSIITGTFLLLLVVMMVFRWGFLVDIELGGAYGFLSLTPKEQITGVDVSTLILILHGWFYVLYLFSDFRVWSLMRWTFVRFIVIALGGVVPFLSFFVERYYDKLAKTEMAAIEAAQTPEVAHQ